MLQTLRTAKVSPIVFNPLLMHKLLIGIGMFFGSTLGSYIPALWGASLFSLVSIVFGFIGGVIGVLLGYHLSKYLGFF
ncbi:MAG: hypothetical protein WCA35_24220 [Kovacikia sp.]